VSWLISKKLYENWHSSLEQEVESLEENSLDGKPSAPLKMNPTPQAYLSPDKMKDFSRPSRFGMTFAPLMEDPGKELLTLYLEDFRAKISVLQEEVVGLKVRVLDFGLKCSESSQKSNQDLFSSKTPPFCVQEDLMLFSKDLPKTGMMLRGECYRHQTVGPITNERGCGFSEKEMWRSPSSQEPGVSADRLVPIAGGVSGGMNRHFDKHTGRMAQIGLEQQIKLRKMFTTPCSSDTGHRTSKYQQGGTPLSMQVGGKLNPTWVEWLMGWPQNWTSLDSIPLENFRTFEGQKLEWWSQEPEIPRIVSGVTARVDRLKAIGNGQVPIVAAVAFSQLYTSLMENT
jgi:hypothetical protein